MKADVTFFNQFPKVPNQKILLPDLEEHQVTLYLKREDLIHPFISGNKFRKLKYNLITAKQQDFTQVLTFGGAFSNHIVATAVAAKKMNLKSIGVIRGDELGDQFKETLATNTSLRRAYENGMHFEFVSREEYRTKSTIEYTELLKQKYGEFYLIPEGGTNQLAVKGCREMLTQDDNEFDMICCPIGTGGTIAGLINQSKAHQTIIGFPALKGNFLNQEIEKYVTKKNWNIFEDYHFGGYAKYTSDFINFLNKFTRETHIQLDPIYTGKMIYGILDLVKKGYFPRGTKLLAIHTGGLQGIEGFNKRLQKKQQQLIEVL